MYTIKHLIVIYRLVIIGIVCLFVFYTKYRTLTIPYIYIDIYDIDISYITHL